MAKSPAHQFGQLLGELIQSAIQPHLEQFCLQHQLYLDYQGKKRTVRKGKKVRWQDLYGNAHDLDFVIEQGGTDTQFGQPVAFIEVAWRRYTKHSRNKAQEIQGAILPLAQTYPLSNPFLGVVLAGDFTASSREQLHSLGFQVLHLPYETVLSALAAEGLTMQFNEQTPDALFVDWVAQFNRLSPEAMSRLKSNLITQNVAVVDPFFARLKARFNRMITRILILPLYGQQHSFASADEAVGFLSAHLKPKSVGLFQRYEVWVEFSNGDKVNGSFEEKQQAQAFLRMLVNR